ncbi:hypothetical protein GCM10023405_18360 [Streptomonospora salina]
MTLPGAARRTRQWDTGGAGIIRPLDAVTKQGRYGPSAIPTGAAGAWRPVPALADYPVRADPGGEPPLKSPNLIALQEETRRGQDAALHPTR